MPISDIITIKRIQRINSSIRSIKKKFVNTTMSTSSNAFHYRPHQQSNALISTNHIQQWMKMLQYIIQSFVEERQLLQYFGFLEVSPCFVRICVGDNLNAPETYSPDMACALAEAICRCKDLPMIAQTLSSQLSISVNSAVQEIMRKKHHQSNIDQNRNIRPIMQQNLRRCLSSLHQLHCTTQQLIQMKNTSFSYEETAHVHLLDKLWYAAFPDKVNFFEDFSERDWGKLGFQKGNDPASDFRGLGLLGLTQLVYFFEHRSLKATQLLSISAKENAYFPFAATALSLGAFTLTLLKEGRLHRTLLKHLDTMQLFRFSHHDNNSYYNDPNYDNSTYNSETADKKTDEEKEVDHEEIQALMHMCHDMFCQLFERFGHVWQREQAKNVMDFPRIFTILQTDVRNEYPALRLVSTTTTDGQKQRQVASIIQ